MSETISTAIHTQGFSATPAIRDYLNRRFNLALGRFSDQVIRVDVFMKDLNGAEKGGKDKWVVASVKVIGQPDIVTETTTHDLYLSISLSARRTRRIVGRTLKRNRKIDREAIRRLPDNVSLATMS